MKMKDSNLIKPISFLLLMVLLVPLTSWGDFSYTECLKSEFTTTTSHEVAPFGLTKNILKVNKKGCTITIHHERYKYLKKKWVVDVCRTPIHVKEGAGAVSVIKRAGNCQRPAISRGDFCQTTATINERLQDDGLIFAPGDRELLSSDHGKIFCISLLLNKYLSYGTMLSLNKEDTFAPPLKPITPISKLAPMVKKRMPQVRMVMPSNAPKLPAASELPTETTPLAVNESNNSPEIAKLPPPSRDASATNPAPTEQKKAEELESF
ncbi:MAG: hypothetical protein HN353_01555 [Bdellovibrionales bacterium]|jgi:hypothetical protein|nr:hypothetical protein [Bdellovibrionales bacterium]MBT3525434.1 hypothetical protein [Bdellovibrionales bacterium]